MARRKFNGESGLLEKMEEVYPKMDQLKREYYMGRVWGFQRELDRLQADKDKHDEWMDAMEEDYRGCMEEAIDHYGKPEPVEE